MLFATQTQLLASLNSAHATGSFARRLQYLARVDVLIIDDFALKPLRPPEDEDFHELIAERYEQAATLLTSNLEFSEWGDAFAANKMLGAATLDRLRHGAYRVVLDGESYRAPKPLAESPTTVLAKGGKTRTLEGCSSPDYSYVQVAPLRRKTLAPLRRKVTPVDCEDGSRCRSVAILPSGLSRPRCRETHTSSGSRAAMCR